MTTWNAELELACRLAREAGTAILRIRDDARRTAHAKADDSPVTAADLAADAVIRAGLAPLGDVVVTEESWGMQAPVPARGRVWFVDPIDGTEDFVAGRADFVVQIALCVDAHPVLGVVYQPMTGVLWRGVVDDAARRCERVDADGTIHPRAVSDAPLPAHPRLTVSISHPSAAVADVVRRLDAQVLPRGSVGLKIGMLVDGDADAYVSTSTRIKMWDTCAPCAVMLAAGGVMSSVSGAPLRYAGPVSHDDGVLAWTPVAARALRTPLDAALAAYRAGTT